MPREISKTDLAIVASLVDATATPSDVSPALARLLITDNLTGLYNRAYFEARLRRELLLVSADRPLSLLVIDVDRFKQFNDRYGHKVGDMALRAVAQALSQINRYDAAACRLGGDEFVLLLPHTGGQQARQLQQVTSDSIRHRSVALPDGDSASITASVGLTWTESPTIDPTNFVHRADSDMYLLKRKQGTTDQQQSSMLERPPFFGRTDWLQRGLALLADARQGRGQLLLLIGPPGVGKSRLALEIAEQVKRRNTNVISTQFDTIIPMAGIRAGVSRLLTLIGSERSAALTRKYWAVQMLTRLSEESSDQLGDVPSAAHIATGLRLLLAKATSARPLVWVLDDVRMADTTTLTILENLAPAVATSRLLLICVARVEGATPEEQQKLCAWWGPLSPFSHCHQWEIPPLDSVTTHTLASWVLGQNLPTASIQLFAKASKGNPLFLVRLGGTGGKLIAAADEGVNLTHLFELQINLCSPHARTLLYTACVLGVELDEQVLRSVVPDTPDNFSHALEELVNTGWLQREGALLRFVHHMARESAYNQIPLDYRRNLHRVAGYVLSGRGGTASAVIAHHFDQAGAWELALIHYKESGEQAEASFALTEAANAYWRYLCLADAVDRLDELAGQLALRSALIMLQNGMPQLFDTLQFAVKYCNDPSERAQAWTLLARAHSGKQNKELAEACLGEALRLLRPLGPTVFLAESLMRQAIELIVNNEHPDTVYDLAIESAAIARNLADPVESVRLSGAVGMALARTGHHKEARSQLQWSIHKAREIHLSKSPKVARALQNVTFLAGDLGRETEHLAYARISSRLARGCGDRGVQYHSHMCLSKALLNLGHIAEALSELAAFEDHLRNVGMKPSPIPTFLRIFGHRYRDEPAEALKVALPFETRFQGDIYNLHPEEIVVYLRALNGEPVDAVTVKRKLNTWPYPGFVCCMMAEICIWQKKIDHAESMVKRARTEAMLPCSLPYIEWLQGCIHSHRNEPAKAAAAWRRATRGSALAYFRASAHRDLAKLLLQQPHFKGADRVVLHLQAAKGLFERMGNVYQLNALNQLAGQERSIVM